MFRPGSRKRKKNSGNGAGGGAAGATAGGKPETTSGAATPSPKKKPKTPKARNFIYFPQFIRCKETALGYWYHEYYLSAKVSFTLAWPQSLGVELIVLKYRYTVPLFDICRPRLSQEAFVGPKHLTNLSLVHYGIFGAYVSRRAIISVFTCPFKPFSAVPRLYLGRGGGGCG